MRPTGMLHLGHYFLLQKWVAMQQQYDCYYFIADYHALTTAAEHSKDIQQHMIDMVTGWLVSGIDPERAVIFVQSQIPEHAELHLALSMICPVPWLERVPHYKDMAASLPEDKINYGFLGYPVLQAADIIAHDADFVPVGEDQEAHIELTARLARTFNERFGKDHNWQDKVKQIINTLPDKEKFSQLCRRVTQDGDNRSRDLALAIIHQADLASEDTERLIGWVEGNGRQILTPPQVIRSDVPRLPGLDGNKMSKSLGNDIGMLEEKSSIASKIKTMPTDPARVRRSDPGTPERCPVWSYHQLFTDADENQKIHAGCTEATIGCIECKAVLADNLDDVIAPLREKAVPLQADQSKITKIIAQGNERARESASATIVKMRDAIGLPRK